MSKVSDPILVCPQCNFESGGDWSQCKSDCPMYMSPYYNENNPFASEAKRRINEAFGRPLEFIVTRKPPENMVVISELKDCASGVEPVYQKYYERKRTPE